MVKNNKISNINMKNIGKNEELKYGSIFNFVIKDLIHNQSLGFTDAFKIKYFVYPTDMINELLMQANFINSFMNVMIFEELEGVQILFSFSTQLYKYFGLTPNMIYFLKKARINVIFESLFPRKNKNNRRRKDGINFDENTYLFEYKIFLPFYIKLLECDGSNEVSNYSQLKDKTAEIASLAHDEKELIFIIHSRENFENCGIKYSIFSIKEQKKKKDIKD